MAGCPTSEQLNAFYDGELDAARRAEIQAHVDGCPICATELRRLAEMSRFMASLRIPHLSQISLHRLHRRIDQAMEEGLFRFVRVFNAIAACVLVAGSAWLILKSRDARAVESATPAAPPWVITEVSDTPSGAYSTPAAAWYLADDSARGDESP